MVVVMAAMKDINDPCLAYGQNLKKWTLVKDLLGGSEAMRDGNDPATGDRWLIKYPAEEASDYIARANATLLHGMFQAGVNRIAAQPFGRAVQVSERDRLDTRFMESPDGSDGYLDDIDGDGASLTDFARRCYEDAAAYGITHALTRHTAKDENDRGGRPIVEHVPALSVIGWIYDDANTLIDVRLSGKIVERDPDNPWQEVELDTVRRYFLGPIEGRDKIGVFSELYVIDEETKQNRQRGQRAVPRVPATLLTNERGQPLTEIPIFTLYFNRVGPMEAEPPLFGLAEANLDHYRAWSDYCSAVRGAAVPMLAMTGIKTSGGEEGEITMESIEKISVNRVLKSAQPDANFRWVEISGAACEAARVRCEEIKKQAVALGAEPEARGGVATATQVWVDERSTEGRVASWNRSTEAFLTLVLWSLGDWMGSPVPREVVVNIPEDRPLTQARVAEVQAVLQVFNGGGLIRPETALAAIQSVLPSLEGLDPEEEVTQARERMEVASAGGFMDSEDDPDPETEDDEEAA